MIFSENITTMSQGPPNPGFRSVKVENWIWRTLGPSLSIFDCVSIDAKYL